MGMRRLSRAGILLIACAAIQFLPGCSRDPNVRKQKYFESGTRHFEQGKYREAAIQYLNAVNIDPRFVEAHYQLAQCYKKLEIWSAAYSELSRTVELQPANLKAQVDLGDLLLKGGEYKAAQERAELVLKQDPNNLDAKILLASVYSGLGDQNAALREIDAAVQLAPNRADTYRILARIQVRAKQVKQAEESLKKALTLDPSSVDVVLALGSYYQQQGRWAEAEQQVRHAIELRPKEVPPRKQLAMLYLGQNKRAEAIQVLTDAKRDLAGDSAGYRMLGDFYFDSGDLENALAEYAKLNQQHPEDIRVRKNYVQLLIMRGRLDEATKFNDEILKANSKDTDSLIYRGEILNLQGRPNDAVQSLDAALKTEPDNANGHYQLGIAFGKLGNTDRAEGEWREAVRLRPDHSGALQALADVALRKRDYNQLAELADKIMGIEKSSPKPYVMRATAKFARRDGAGAEADLKKAIEVAPQDPLGYSRLAGMYLVQKRFSESLKFYEEALKRDPDFREALQGLVSLDLQQNQPSRAIARLSALVEKNPNNGYACFLLGQAYLVSKDLAQAETALSKAVSLEKGNMEALVLLAQVQGRRGSVEKAIATYNQTIQTNPRAVVPYVLLGVLEESRGNWQKAMELYQKALQVQPDYPLAANNLAYLMLENGGNIDVALSYAQVARRGMPNSPSAADTLGWAFYKKGTYGLAIGLLEEAVNKADRNALYHYHLGMAYQAAGKKQLAKQHLKRALEVNPNLPQAEDIRKSLAAQSGM